MNKRPSPLLTINDAADYLRVSTKTIRRMISSNELLAAKVGGQWRIRPEDLQLMLREQLSR